MGQHGSSLGTDIGDALAVDAFSHAGLLRDILTCRDADRIESDILNPMANILRARRFLYFKVEQTLRSDRHISGALYSQWDSPTFVDYCDNFYAIDPLHNVFDPWFESRGQMGGNALLLRETDLPGWRAGDFNSQFLSRYGFDHVISLTLPVLIGAVPKIVCFGFERSHEAEAYTTDELNLVSSITPALRCALERIEHAQALALSQSIIDVMCPPSEGRGFVLLDADLQVREASPEGLTQLGLNNADYKSTIFGEVRARLLNLELNHARNGAVDLQLPSEIDHQLAPSASVRIIAQENGERWFLLLTAGQVESDHFHSLCRSYGLSRREIEICRLVSVGQSNAVVAGILGIAVRTVENHLHAIYGKCNVANRTELASRLFSN